MPLHGDPLLYLVARVIRTVEIENFDTDAGASAMEGRCHNTACLSQKPRQCFLHT
jgi:hypothetical protein